MSLPEFSLTGPVGATTVTGYGDSPEAALDSWCQQRDQVIGNVDKPQRFNGEIGPRNGTAPVQRERDE